ncbi:MULTISPECIES: BlaI/MecI/CopY family transcriptional regulator [unclassified Phenylobacterium]|uniref:BlaI/MecI/CopY family transcriptional regulator n=1 Tax=unclassified Phenylobacterium TaxID=2640670 RepID=UPI003ECE0224
MGITEAERQVMEALWSGGPLTPDELVKAVAPAQGWGEATVKTLVNRLLKKGAIASRKQDGRTLYAPLVARDEYVTAESQGLLDRLFGGELAPMVAHFAHRQALSDEEKARLRRLLDELDRE